MNTNNYCSFRKNSPLDIETIIYLHSESETPILPSTFKQNNKLHTMKNNYTLRNGNLLSDTMCILFFSLVALAHKLFTSNRLLTPIRKTAFAVMAFGGFVFGWSGKK